MFWTGLLRICVLLLYLGGAYVCGWVVLAGREELLTLRGLGYLPLVLMSVAGFFLVIVALVGCLYGAYVTVRKMGATATQQAIAPQLAGEDA